MNGTGATGVEPRRPATDIPGKKRKPFDLIGFVLRRGLIIGLAGTLLGGLCGAILWPLGSPVYQTVAVMLLDPSKQPTVSGRDRSTIPGNLRDWSRTQLSRLMSKEVMTGAIRRVPEKNLPDFLIENPESPGAPFRLMKRIDAYEKNGTYLLELRIKNGSPAGLAEILNAVMEEFLDKMRLEMEASYESRLSYLREEREKITSRLAEEEERLRQMAATMDNKAFLHEGYNSHLNKVNLIQRLYWEAFDQENQAKATLRKVQADKQALLEMSLKPFADQRVADNFGINRIEQWTYEQLQRMRASIDGLTEENDDRKYVEMRMQAMNQYLQEYKDRVQKETIVNLREKRLFELERDVALARSAAEAAEKATEILAKRLDAAQKEAGEISLAIFQASSPSLARNQLRNRLQALSNRIDDAEMQAKAPIPVQVDQRADPPVSPTSTSNMKLALAGFVLGFGLVGALVLLYELVDDRIRSTRDLRLALAGDVPEPIVQVTGMDASRLMLDAPEHNAARVVRDLGARLMHDRVRHGGNIFAVIGSHPRAGTSWLSLQVAQALRSLDGPVLLVEWNFADAGLRETIGLTPGDGIESYLRGDQELEHILRKDPERKLDLLLAEGGGRPFSLDRFGELLPGLSDDYAMIVVDAGCLPGDLARLACREADAAMIVSAWKRGRYADLRNVYEQTVRMEVPAVTAILNRAPKPEEHPIQAGLAWGTDQVSFLMGKGKRLIGRKA